MNDISTPQENWETLRSGGIVNDELNVSTLEASVGNASGRVRFAIGPAGEARLLLPLGDREEIAEIFDSPAIRVTVSKFDVNRKTKRFLDLSCTLPDLESVFAEVANEILKRIGSDVLSAKAAASTLSDFRSLLIKPEDKVVDLSRVAGLVGELWFLNRLLESVPKAWLAWQGPLGDRHDFTAAKTSVEVKTSTKASKNLVRINTQDQLSEPSGGEIYLYHLNLERSGTGRLSISGLASSCLSLANDPARVTELLARMGCDDPSSEVWNRFLFRIERESLYKVRADFPRIHPSHFVSGFYPSGVSGITYDIDLDQAEHLRVDDAEIPVFLDNFAMLLK